MQLKSEDSLLTYYFNSTNTPMWVQDSSTLSFLEVNEAFIKVIGYSKSELLALTAWDLEVTDSKNSNDM